jgi:hypothetical protein
LPPAQATTNPPANSCSSDSCPDMSMPWSSPLSTDCYATQAKDYYVKCDGKKATLTAIANFNGTTITAVTCTPESCPDSNMPWASPLSGQCYATQAKDYYVKCDGMKARVKIFADNGDGTSTSLKTSAPTAQATPTRAPTTRTPSTPSTGPTKSADALLPSVKATTSDGLRTRPAPLLGVPVLLVASLAMRI